MYSKKDLDNLAKEYNSIETPKNLEKVMIDMLENNTTENKIIKTKKHNKFGFAIAAASLLFVAVLNTNATFANTVKEIPIIGGVAKFFTFRIYDEKINDSQVEIDSGNIVTNAKSDLLDSLNEKYAKQSKKLYDDFIKKINYTGDRTALFSNYSIKADNGTTISIENAVLEIQGSSNEKLSYDTIDLNSNVYITLESLFKDDKYIKLISDNIKEQINKKIKENQDPYYTDDEAFKQIDKNQVFYINNEHELVIVFEKYSIAPGYMGSPEFIIPTDVIKNDLAGDKYIH